MHNYFESLACEGVQKLTPYQPGKPLEELERELGLSSIVKLASNENPLGCSPKVSSLLSQLPIEDIARYPDGNGFTLKTALSSHLDVEPSCLTLGNGSNEVLDLIARTFVTPADEVIYSQYAFAVYPLAVQAIGARAVEVPAKNYGHDLDAFLRAITDKTKLIFIANPNNPTGTHHALDDLSQFIAQVPQHVLMVVDEAYFEYAAAAAEDYDTVLPLLLKHQNLIVTRTFSKAYGLAGLRLGYAISHENIANLLNRVREPFNVNRFALEAGVAALDDQAFIKTAREMNAVEKHRLETFFNELNLSHIPSAGNFILLEVPQEPVACYQSLLHQGVIVRPVKNYGLNQHLRITIGTAEENAIFIDAFQRMLGGS